MATFAVWGTLVGIAFFGIYPTTNWLTGLRSHQYFLFIVEELAIPFVPEFIWLYLSMYGLFALPPFFLEPPQLRRLAKELISATCLAGVAFLLFPARLGFSRVLPEDGFYRDIYGAIFAVDQPFNLVPSLHVVYSTAIVLAVAARAGKGARAVFYLWLCLIVASTLLVHQHHVLDAVSGLGLAFVMRLFWKDKNV